MKDILVVCLQERDVRAIRAAGLDERFRIHYAGADLDEGDEFDPVQFLEECDGLPADGVVGTKDRSSLLAALIAERRGLPGPTPRALIACQFKPTARAPAACDGAVCDAALRAARRPAAVRPAVLREARRRPSLPARASYRRSARDRGSRRSTPT